MLNVQKRAEGELNDDDDEQEQHEEGELFNMFSWKYVKVLWNVRGLLSLFYLTFKLHIVLLMNAALILKAGDLYSVNLNYYTFFEEWRICQHCNSSLLSSVIAAICALIACLSVWMFIWRIRSCHCYRIQWIGGQRHWSHFSESERCFEQVH